VRQILAPEVRPDEALPGLQLFERLAKYSVEVGSREIPLDYEVSDLPFGTEARARFDSDAGKIVVALSNTTYEDLEAEVPRARFTLGHEIGHAVLHSAELVRLSSIPERVAALHRGQANHPIYQDVEWQANSFSSALHMPAQGLVTLEKTLGRLDSTEVRKRFLVSDPAARIRVENFNKRRSELL